MTMISLIGMKYRNQFSWKIRKKISLVCRLLNLAKRVLMVLVIPADQYKYFHPAEQYRYFHPADQYRYFHPADQYRYFYPCRPIQVLLSLQTNTGTFIPADQYRYFHPCRPRQENTGTFVNGVCPDETAHNKPSHQDLHCFQSCCNL